MDKEQKNKVSEERALGIMTMIAIFLAGFICGGISGAIQRILTQ